MPPPLERLSSFVPMLFAGVNLKSSLSCSLPVKQKSQPFLCKTIGSEDDKNRQIVLVTICRSYLVFGCCLGLYLSSKGKSRFYSCDFEAPKNGFWAAKKPDKIGLRLSKKSDLVIARPLAAVAISQNCFDILEDFGEFGTACMRLPRRFAPTGKRSGRIRKAPSSPTATTSQ